MARHSLGTRGPLGCAGVWVGALPLCGEGLWTQTMLAPKGFLGIWKDALLGRIRRERALKDVVLNEHFSQILKEKSPQIRKATNLG